MCTKNELHLILQAVTQAYQAVYGDNIVKIVLYGSYARGDNQSDSDIDIVAIVQGERGILQKGLKYERYKNDLPYYRNIEREGVEIVA